MSDHGTHEAIYLPDPDGNGLELAADRPRESWPARGAYAGGPQPLDVRDLWRQAGEPRRHVGEGCAQATCTCTWPTSRRRARSTATCSAST